MGEHPYLNETFHMAFEVRQRILEETKGDWGHLEKDYQELRTRFIQGQITQVEFKSMVAPLEVQRTKLAKDRRVLERERLWKHYERVELIKDVFAKIGLTMAASGAAGITLWGVGTAGTYAATGLTAAGEAATNAFFPMLRAAGIVCLATRVANWWSVSLSFGGSSSSH